MTGYQLLFFVAAGCFAFVAFTMLRRDPVDRQEVARYFVATILALSFMFLTACGDEHPKALGERIVEKDIPVAVQPIKPADIPALPGQLGPHPSDARDGEAVALAGRCDALAFVIKAFPLLLLSAGLPPAQAPVYPECAKH